MDAEDVADHAKGVAHGADFAVVAEVPLDGDFPDVQVFSTGEVEDFDVEGPTRERLLAEEVFGNFGTKAFKTALGVVQPRQDEQLNDEVDRPPAQVAVGWFVVAHCAGGFAGCDGDIDLFKRWGDEFLQFLDGHGEVGVTDEAIVAARFQHAAPDGVALAAPLFLKDAQGRPALRKFLRKFKRMVGTSVLYDDYFE